MTNDRDPMKRATLIALLVATVTAAILIAHEARAAEGVDYKAAKFTTDKTVVVEGDTFTRRLVIRNNGTVTAPVQATINGVSHAAFVSVTSSRRFDRCGVYYFPSGALNYVRCYGTKIPKRAWMEVTYQAPASGWVGWTYTGGGGVDAVGDADTTNNNTGPVVSTTVVAAS